MKNQKLHIKLIILNVSISVIPLIIVGIISFYITSSLIEKNISMYILQTLKQATFNLETIISDINDLALFTIANGDVRHLLKYPEDNEIIDYKNRVGNYFINLCNSKNYIKSITLINNNNKIYQYGAYSEDIDIKMIEKYASSAPSYYISNAYEKKYAYIEKRPVFSYVIPINDINTLQKIGILSVDVDEIIINQIYKSLTLGENGEIFILDKGGKILSSSNKGNLSNYILNEESMKKIIDEKNGYFKQKINETDMLITFYNSKKDGLSLVQIISYRDVMKEKRYIMDSTIFTAILFSIIAIILSVIFSFEIAKPIKKLMIAMENVEKGNFNIQIDVNSDDEIGKLSKGFNKMIKRINVLIFEIYETQLKEKEAQIKILQSQVNPHFLYNTFDTIYWMSRLEKAPKTSEMVEALSKIFRYSLGNDDWIIEIEKEKEYLNNYLIIQKVRYDDRVKVHIEIDDEVNDYITVKMTLQPIVENVFVHGVDGSKDSVELTVKGYKEKNNIIFKIIDNGAGTQEENIKRYLINNISEKNPCIGLKNVNDRIRFYFGDDYGLSFESHIGDGTKVTIRIPAIKKGGKI